MVVFPEYPYQLGPSAKQPVFEFHYRACLGSPMGERHAEPIRRYIDEFPSERPRAALLNNAYFAFTSDAQIHPAIPARLFLARVQERNPEEVEVGRALLLYIHVYNFVLSIRRSEGLIKADQSWLPEVNDSRPGGARSRPSPTRGRTGPQYDVAPYGRFLVSVDLGDAYAPPITLLCSSEERSVFRRPTAETASVGLNVSAKISVPLPGSMPGAMPRTTQLEVARRNNSDQGRWNTHTAGARSTF
jgi:hypothetical protein